MLNGYAQKTTQVQLSYVLQGYLSELPHNDTKYIGMFGHVYSLLMSNKVSFLSKLIITLCTLELLAHMYRFLMSNKIPSQLVWNSHSTHWNCWPICTDFWWVTRFVLWVNWLSQSRHWNVWSMCTAFLCLTMLNFQFAL
jgi:hypothetical protein